MAFRVDASPQLGTGHLVRCLTLADALRREGARIRFISRDLPPHLESRLAEHGLDYRALATADAGPGPGAAADVGGTCRILADASWDWVVVDHYGLDAAWQSAVRGVAARVLAIDDLANRRHDCDLLLDQNHVPGGDGRYDSLVPGDCRRLLGPRYALLRPEYRAHRDSLRARPPDARRVLVFFGGTDPQNMTDLAVRALSGPELRHLELDVVCGADPARRRELEAWAAERPGLTLHGPRPHLADLMTRADLGLGAGGATTWERMCLGLPSLVITLADNQVAVANGLAAEGLISLIGDASSVSPAQVRDAVLAALPAAQHRRAVEAGMALSDGGGVTRVIAAMAGVAPQRLAPPSTAMESV